MEKGSELRVQGLGIRVHGLGNRIYRFRDWD
jgi:hypothetical protein